MPGETFKCAICGESHIGSPRSFAADFPDAYANLNSEERKGRATIDSDQCIVDHKQYFVRGYLEIPILDSREPLIWGLWASVRKDEFGKISDSRDFRNSEYLNASFKGRLGNSLSFYPETLNLHLQILLQPVGTNPLFVIQDVDHPMSIDQRSGITLASAIQKASLLFHKNS